MGYIYTPPVGYVCTPPVGYVCTPLVGYVCISPVGYKHCPCEQLQFVELTLYKESTIALPQNLKQSIKTLE